METNLEKTPGYGSDCYCEAAKAKIREACKAPDAEIFFLVGGTQTNAAVIDAMLKSYQGVIAASTGRISVHEAGAIDFGGHKVLTLPHHNGKISASQIRALLEQYQNDANHDHMVMPGMVYLSHPTEYGTLYSREELIEISSLCHSHQIPLYLDGAVWLMRWPARRTISKWLCALLRFPDESGLLCHRERRDGAAGKAGGIRLLGSV